MKHKNLTDPKKKKPKKSFLRIDILFLALALFLEACASNNTLDLPNPIMAAEGSEGEWVWIPMDEMRCRDGSNTGIAVRLSSNLDQEKLVIYLRGGNACFNAPTCAITPYNYERSDLNADASMQAGIFNETRSENPFQDWHKVFVPYCTGDVHSGSLNNPTPFLPALTRAGRVTDGSVEAARYDSGLFRGYRNMEIVTRAASSYFRDRGVEEVVLTGSSAGGFGVYVNYDQVAQAFGSVKVTGMADGAPIFDDNAIVPDCGLQLLELLWGMRLPDDYDTYVDSGDHTQHRVTAIDKYLASKYPTRQFGLLSHTEDAVIRGFYGILGITGAAAASPLPSITCSTAGTTAGADIMDLTSMPPDFRIRAAAYSGGLTALQNSFIMANMTENWKVYYDGAAAEEHTFLISDNKFYDTRSSDGTPIYTWINSLLMDMAEHKTN